MNITYEMKSDSILRFMQDNEGCIISRDKALSDTRYLRSYMRHSTSENSTLFYNASKFCISSLRDV